MFLGLLTLTLLTTTVLARCPSPAVSHARPERLVVMHSHVPAERHRRAFAWFDPKDDSDEEGRRKTEPFTGLVPVAPRPPHPITAPQLPLSPAARPAVVLLIYQLCTLLR
jgi:hypothetical protein